MLDNLPRRERQILDIVDSLGQASADDVVAALPHPPTRTAVRTFLRLLEDKKLLAHHKQGRAFVYTPTRPPEKAGKSAFRRVLETFFAGSIEKALADPATRLSRHEADGLAQLIADARTSKKGAPRAR